MKRIIWETEPTLNSEDTKMIKECLEMAGNSNPTDEDVMDYFTETVCGDRYHDCQEALNVSLPGKIIVIADIGTWRGRHSGYAIMTQSLNDILTSHVHGDSQLSVYGDGYNIRADETHHDGVNHYLFRVAKPGRKIGILLEAVASGMKISNSMLNYYTSSLHPYVADIYGWPCRQRCHKGLNFYNCLRLLQECVKAGLIKTSVNNKSNILVYRMAGKKSPEGWYEENIFSTAKELVADRAGQKYLMHQLNEKGIEFKEESYV